REPEVVDLLAALALDEERRLQPERPEHRGVERERALEIAADKVDVTEAYEHDRSLSATAAIRRGTLLRLPDHLDVEGDLESLEADARAADAFRDLVAALLEPLFSRGCSLI